MFKLIAGRLLVGLLTLWAISVMVFLGTEILPGDVAEAILGRSATPENLAALREKLGLNLPPWERYLNWLGGMLGGDLGSSLVNGVAVERIIGQRIWNTINLALYATALAVPLSLLLGLLCAGPPGRKARSTGSRRRRRCSSSPFPTS